MGKDGFMSQWETELREGGREGGRDAVNQSEEQSKLKHCRLLQAHLLPVCYCHIKHNLHRGISGQVPGNRARIRTEVTLLLPTVAGYHINPH